MYNIFFMVLACGIGLGTVRVFTTRKAVLGKANRSFHVVSTIQPCPPHLCSFFNTNTSLLIEACCSACLWTILKTGCLCHPHGTLSYLGQVENLIRRTGILHPWYRFSCAFFWVFVNFGCPCLVSRLFRF